MTTLISPKSHDLTIVKQKITTRTMAAKSVRILLPFELFGIHLFSIVER